MTTHIVNTRTRAVLWGSHCAILDVILPDFFFHETEGSKSSLFIRIKPWNPQHERWTILICVKLLPNIHMASDVRFYYGISSLLLGDPEVKKSWWCNFKALVLQAVGLWKSNNGSALECGIIMIPGTLLWQCVDHRIAKGVVVGILLTVCGSSQDIARKLWYGFIEPSTETVE